MKAIFLTDSALMEKWWDKAAIHFDPVVSQAARGEFTVSDIRKMCDERRATCAVVTVGDEVILSVAFEFVYYPRITACNIMALGGSHWADAESLFFVTFKEWCKSMGVTVIEASCSSAMSRLLWPYGFAKTYEVVRLNL